MADTDHPGRASGERWNVAPGLLRRVVEAGSGAAGDPNVIPMRKK